MSLNSVKRDSFPILITFLLCLFIATLAQAKENSLHTKSSDVSGNSLRYDETDDILEEVAEARSKLRGYVLDIKNKYKEDQSEYREALKKHREVVAQYNGWATIVKNRILKGKVKDLSKDKNYIKAASEAKKARDEFVNYVNSKVGGSKGVLFEVFDFGIKAFKAIIQLRKEIREGKAKQFHDDALLPDWEKIAVST